MVEYLSIKSKVLGSVPSVRIGLGLVGWVGRGSEKIALCNLRDPNFLSPCLRLPRAGIARVLPRHPTHSKALFRAHAPCVMVGR